MAALRPAKRKREWDKKPIHSEFGATGVRPPLHRDQKRKRGYKPEGEKHSRKRDTKGLIRGKEPGPSPAPAHPCSKQLQGNIGRIGKKKQVWNEWGKLGKAILGIVWKERGKAGDGRKRRDQGSTNDKNMGEKTKGNPNMKKRGIKNQGGHGSSQNEEVCSYKKPMGERGGITKR